MAPSKVVLITGCSHGGIGSALAVEFHNQGHTVFATARNPSKTAHLRDLGITTLEMDVTSDSSIAAAVDAVRRATSPSPDHPQTGHLDVLINNAGVNHVMPFADCTPASLRRVLDTNILGVFAVTHAFLPLLIAAKGLVATIGSVNQVFNPPYQAAYNASKAAIAAFGNTLRVELAPFGVRVVTVVTGAVRSSLFENASTGEGQGEGEKRGPKLPEGSMYGQVREKIKGLSFLEGTKWTPAEQYARQVVTPDRLKESTGRAPMEKH